MCSTVLSTIQQSYEVDIIIAFLQEGKSRHRGVTCSPSHSYKIVELEFKPKSLALVFSLIRYMICLLHTRERIPVSRVLKDTAASFLKGPTTGDILV